MRKPFVVALSDVFFGDNGKGRLVANLVDYYRALGYRVCVVRALGGPNSGHETMRMDGKLIKRHLLPSVYDRDVPMIIGTGAVLNPVLFTREIEAARAFGLEVDRELKISGRTTVIAPWHRLEDLLREEAAGSSKIGTTLNGIGPTYESRARRSDRIYMAQLLRGDWESHYQSVRDDALRRLRALYDMNAEVGRRFTELEDGFLESCKALRPFIRETDLLWEELYGDVDVAVLEGAQGLGIDVDEGTIGYTTSTTLKPLQQAAASGLDHVDAVVYAKKAYGTRVGGGPFPTEITDEKEATALRNAGSERGTTTGRDRRVGHFDAVYARHALRVMGAYMDPSRSGLAITKLDVVSGRTLPICTAYELEGKRITHVPDDTMAFERCSPVYGLNHPGWQGDVSRCRSIGELHPGCASYIRSIADAVGFPVRIATVNAKPEGFLLLGEEGSRDDWLLPNFAPLDHKPVHMGG